MRIDYNYTRDIAWIFILEQGIKTLPVDTVTLAIDNDYIIYTYCELAKLIGRSVAYIIEKYDDDGFVFWSDKKHSYTICYNSDKNESIIRWTVMHEIAHIQLKHVTPATPTLKRERGTPRPIIEVEADSFARRILCPSIVLHECRAISIPDIMQLCGISYTAAEYSREYMQKLEQRGKFGTRALEVKVCNQFYKFIKQYNDSDINFNLKCSIGLRDFLAA